MTASAIRTYCITFLGILLYLAEPNKLNALTAKEWKNLYEEALGKFESSEFDQALVLIDSFLEYDLREDGYLLCKGYVLKAETHLGLNDSKEALNSVELAFECSNELESIVRIRLSGEINLIKGEAFLQEKRNSEALTVLASALSILLASDSQDDAVYCYGLLAETFLEEELYERAATYCEEGIELATSLQKQDFIADFLNVDALASYKLGYFKEALFSQLKANQINKSLNRKYRFTSGVFDLALIYDGRNLQDSSKYFYQICLDSSVKNGYTNLIFSVYRNWAYTAIYYDSFETALTFLDSALYYANAKHYSDDIIDLKTKKAEIFLDLGDARKGINELKEIQFPFGDTISNETQISFYRISSDLYSKIGDHTNAYIFLSEAHKLLSKTFIEVRKSMLKREEDFYSNANNTQDRFRNKSLIRMINAEDANKSSRRDWIYVLVLGMILVAVLIFAFFAVRRRNLQLVDETSNNDEFLDKVKEESIKDLILERSIIEEQQKMLIRLKEGEVHEARRIIRLEKDDSMVKVIVEKVITEPGEKDQYKELKIRVWGSLDGFEDFLPTPLFCRTHRSHIVNIDNIKNESISKSGIVVLKNGDEIPVSVRKKTEVKNVIYKHVIVS